jgi:formylglycine-generating enzyme required for sulfatase activity
MSDDPIPRLARVPRRFVMGADDGDEDERPAHKAHLDEFQIGVYPVTNDEYAFRSGYRAFAPPVREMPVMVTADRENQFRELAGPFVWSEKDPRMAAAPIQ